MGIVLWTDGSKLDTENVGAAVTWRNKCLGEKIKRFFDAELLAIGKKRKKMQD